MNRLSPMRRATIRQIVTIHRSDYGVREIQMTHCFRNMTRLFGIESARLALTDRAESAVARADIAAEHERCRPIRPAFENIRALRFLTNRVQIQALNQLEQMILVRRIAQTNPQPFGFRLTRPGVQDLKLARQFFAP